MWDLLPRVEATTMQALEEGRAEPLCSLPGQLLLVSVPRDAFPGMAGVGGGGRSAPATVILGLILTQWTPGRAAAEHD